MRDAVGAAAHQQRIAEHARAVVAEGAAIEQHLDLARDQRAVALERRSSCGSGTDGARAPSRNPPRAIRISLTGRFAFIASSTTIGWTCGSILLPKPAPMRGVRQRSRDIGRPSDSQTLAWTRNTDWFADHSVTRPSASISASAPHGSSETCACGLRLVTRLRQ